MHVTYVTFYQNNWSFLFINLTEITSLSDSLKKVMNFGADRISNKS